MSSSPAGGIRAQEFVRRAARERAREAEAFGPHEHGGVGSQRLALAVASRAEVDRMHALAVDAGWSVVREPKAHPRFAPTYDAPFVEEADGIRIEYPG